MEHQPNSPEGGEQHNEEKERRFRPRIYVRCLAAYNNGTLHGCWIDADQDEEALRHDVETMLNASPVLGAEEYAIHDHEGFTGYPLGEYEDLAFVSRLAQGIAIHGHAFAAYADWIGPEDVALERFNEHLEGTYPTREAWAEEVANEVFEWPRYLETIPEPLRSHITLDFASLALELEQDRHVVEGDEGVYVSIQMTKAKTVGPHRFVSGLWPHQPSCTRRMGGHTTLRKGVSAMTEPNGGKAGVKTLGIRLPDELHAQFALVAQLDGINLTAAVQRAVELYVQTKRSESDFTERANQALAEIEREAASRRTAIEALFGQTAQADDTKP
ncbi:MAG: antirestriction protein ArdA, partial [Actinobacteria bacterium]|nr:antirestriction protein ArdA [Actinomycetota bacterium]